MNCLIINTVDGIHFPPQTPPGLEHKNRIFLIFWCRVWAPGPLKFGFSTYFHPEFNPQNS